MIITEQAGKRDGVTTAFFTFQHPTCQQLLFKDNGGGTIRNPLTRYAPPKMMTTIMMTNHNIIISFSSISNSLTRHHLRLINTLTQQ